MSNFLENIQAQNLTWQVSICEKAESSDTLVYRGDLILQEGKLTIHGTRGTPEAVIKQVVLTAKGEKIEFFAGHLQKLESISLFCEKYLAQCAAGIPLFFFVENIKEKLVVEIEGHLAYLYPLVEGVVWNEFNEMLGLEKGDFKGLGAGDKVVKVADESKTLKPKNVKVSLEEALARTVVVHKELRGAI
ncbi:hypothetical protein [Beggiatoa leptomitoformis]|uniref:Uncharacterized protein n=1 Tax=Beggiatoa leptomitoformis TaxID=288004 RepID=A0A2N9YC64_9GAMM|nr:hypothetical protein [Beggiatoa leptomitoformis]ALG69276.2 hypothetical protein AL038_01490 [Beggiatoa leptomitoformis]AUI68039.1 hypothetical protein BLE401_04530 [Beggiatoa leptomitoformis]